MAAETCGQDLPFFEMADDVLDDDSATRKPLVFGFFGVAQGAVAQGFNLGRSFVKDLPNPLKSRAEVLHPSHFAALLQNIKSFKGV